MSKTTKTPTDFSESLKYATSIGLFILGIIAFGLSLCKTFAFWPYGLLGLITAIGSLSFFFVWVFKAAGRALSGNERFDESAPPSKFLPAIQKIAFRGMIVGVAFVIISMLCNWHEVVKIGAFGAFFLGALTLLLTDNHDPERI